MLESLSKTKKLLAYMGILTTSFAVMYTTIFQVINYNIYEAFPNQTMAVNFFISGPYIVIMLVSFVSPAVYNRTNRKTALLAASIIFTVSALLFTRQTSIYGFITVNLICGVASAYINVAAVTMIAEIYVDEETRARYMGYYNSAMAAVGSLFSVIAGFLAHDSWIGAFNVYWSAALMTLMVALFIPSLPKKMFEDRQGAKTKGFGFKKLGARFWILVLDFVALGITYFVPGFFLSLYIAEHGLGDVAYAGIALSVDTFGGAVFAFFFNRSYKKFGSYTSVAAFVLMSTVLFILYLFPNRILLVMIVTLMGGSYMTCISYAYQETTAVVPVEYVSAAMGIVVGVQYIATFLATYITTGLMKLLHTVELTPILVFPAAWILVFAGIEYFSIKRHQKMTKNHDNRWRKK
ncbi:MFS transporter [Eubacterium callanderi]|uniref:MFS transporter n=1 Tax=Eubacterium callanderi TaxID=53442 RepID=UPI001C128869|nr:MFS transporter [Eubacterium callanderi]MBU5305068.1 MFS transporter [Eubacterium callanderi]